MIWVNVSLNCISGHADGGMSSVDDDSFVMYVLYVFAFTFTGYARAEDDDAGNAEDGMSSDDDDFFKPKKRASEAAAAQDLAAEDGE